MPVGPWLRTPKTKRELRGQFLSEILAPKPGKSARTLTHTRFFIENGSEPTHCLRSGTIYAAFVSAQQIAFVFL